MARSDYTLVVFDKDGHEQKDEHGDLGSQKVAAKMAGVTDVFIMSHGWMGDVVSAVGQYNGWTDQMMACKGDIATLSASRPGFKPLLVGFHWPSLPWGDEQQVGSFAIEGAAPALDPVADFALRLGGTPQIHEAVVRVFSEVAASPDPSTMTAGLADAYLHLNSVLNLGAEGAGAAPGADRPPYNPREVFDAAQQSEDDVANFAAFSLGGLLSPLRTASFWTMKDRGRRLGESAGAGLLIQLQDAAKGRDVRFHLMGHSFGCIVVSAMLTGAHVSGRVPAPVHSAVLVQGAMSLWSFTARIPKLLSIPGYFQSAMRGKKVTGPVVTTQSTFDRALGVFYPVASGIAAQVSFGAVDFPLFGALGAFGAQGVDPVTKLEKMADVKDQYAFHAGGVYNVQSDNVIKDGGGLSGAHSDIYKPEVGHLVWQAAMTAV